MRDPSPMPYVVTRDRDRWEFRPCAPFAVLMVTMFAAGSALALYPAGVFLRKMGDPVGLILGAVFLAIAGLMAAGALWAWRTRDTPLTVERSGRVSYGQHELCPAGSVRAVRIAPSRGGEWGDCEVCLEVDGGQLVSVPSQYFAVFRAREQAWPFAEALAAALGVQVTDAT
jgi:hypothetical protein